MRHTLTLCLLGLTLLACSGGPAHRAATTPAGTAATAPPNTARAGPPAAAGTSSPAAASAGTPAASPSTSVTTPPGASYIFADPTFVALPGATAHFGRLGGAVYQIEVPNDWNGDLVLYAHGYVGTDPVLFVQPPPLRAYLVAHGFAWAASSYSANGYDPDVGLQDTLALRDLSRGSIGAPVRTYIYGTSMGGHIVVSALEQHPELFDGGFSECGVVTGVEEIDFLDSYVALAAYLTNTPLFPLPSAAAYTTALRERVLPALGLGSAPTQAGRQFEDVIANLTGGPRPWRHEGFLDRRTADLGLGATEDPAHPSLATRSGTNINVRYHIDPGLGIDDATLNGQVPRIAPDPEARDPSVHPDFAPRSGRLRAPLLTIHTTGDHFVPISLEQSYRRTVDAAGAGDLLVQRAIRRPDHCQFTEAERERGFADLVAWVERGVKPEGDDFTNPDLRDVGRAFTAPMLPGDPGEE